MEVFLAIKAFMMVCIILFSLGSETFFDFNAIEIHLEFTDRLKQALHPLGFTRFDLPIEFTFAIFGMIAATMQYIVVRI
jgi:hypothetical protein